MVETDTTAPLDCPKPGLAADQPGSAGYQGFNGTGDL